MRGDVPSGAARSASRAGRLRAASWPSSIRHVHDRGLSDPGARPAPDLAVSVRMADAGRGDYRDWQAIDDWAAAIAQQLQQGRIGAGGPDARASGRRRYTPDYGLPAGQEAVQDFPGRSLLLARSGPITTALTVLRELRRLGFARRLAPIHGKDGAGGPGDQRPTKIPAYLTPPNFTPDGPA
jgi:hypothetical protein